MLCWDSGCGGRLAGEERAWGRLCREWVRRQACGSAGLRLKLAVLSESNPTVLAFGLLLFTVFVTSEGFIPVVVLLGARGGYFHAHAGF